MRWRAVFLVLPAVFLMTGCRQDMTTQPKLRTLGSAEAFPNDAAARPLPKGVVARNGPGQQGQGQGRPPVNAALLKRGQQQFNVFCAPCHGEDGYGDGMVVERGFPAPPSYHSQGLRQASDRLFFTVITNGIGRMYSYADRVSPRDRWAIIAYIRALQLSQYATLDQAPEAREKIK